MAGTSLGKVPADSIHEVTRIPKPLIDRLSAIGDLTGTVSDVLDELAVAGAIPGSVLRPTVPGSRIVGTAITLRDEPRPALPHLYARTNSSRRGEIEAHNLARPGDVLVIEGLAGVSSMGGISASIGKRQGEIGAVVDGGVRDVAEQREIAYPVWSRDVTPITGKWRIQSVEVNGPVRICGIVVHAGDLVVADDSGVCFVPAALVEQLIARVEAIARGEEGRFHDIHSGVPVPELVKRPQQYLKDVVPQVDPTEIRPR